MTVGAAEKRYNGDEATLARIAASKATVLGFYADSGNITKACKAGGISRQTFYRWREEDKQFKVATDDVREAMIDVVESALLGRVKAGDTTAMIFFLKCQAKHRGYVERTEITGKEGGPIRVDRREEVLRHLNDGELDTLASILAKGEQHPDAVRSEEGAVTAESAKVH